MQRHADPFNTHRLLHSHLIRTFIQPPVRHLHIYTVQLPLSYVYQSCPPLPVLHLQVKSSTAEMLRSPTMTWLLQCCILLALVSLKSVQATSPAPTDAQAAAHTPQPTASLDGRPTTATAPSTTNAGSGLDGATIGAVCGAVAFGAIICYIVVRSIRAVRRIRSEQTQMQELAVAATDSVRVESTLRASQIQIVVHQLEQIYHPKAADATPARRAFRLHDEPADSEMVPAALVDHASYLAAHRPMVNMADHVNVSASSAEGTAQASFP